jgi:hypothetical protein
MLGVARDFRISMEDVREDLAALIATFSFGTPHACCLRAVCPLHQYRLLL